MPILSVRDLTHVYSQGTPFEKVAIDHISLDIARGELLGVIGHTGSGKSTFIQHLNGLLKPSSGEVCFDGRNIHESREFARDVRFRVGLVFQYPEYQLFEETSAPKTWALTAMCSMSACGRPPALRAWTKAF